MAKKAETDVIVEKEFVIEKEEIKSDNTINKSGSPKIKVE